MSDKFRTFAMSYFCSFPPKVTFPRCSEEFLFPSTKIQNIYHIDNHLVVFLNLFRDYPYLIVFKNPQFGQRVLPVLGLFFLWKVSKQKYIY